jgi:outer membrane protein assembly factor BamA
MRLLFVLATFLITLVSWSAHADAPKFADWKELPRARARPEAPLYPKIGEAHDLAGIPAGTKISRVEVHLDAEDVWDDVLVPEVHTVHPGENLSPATARRALNEVLETGRFARGRVAAVMDGAGARLIVRVSPRKLIQSLRVDLHGAAIDQDDVVREADLTEGGEIVGSEVEEKRRRIEDLFARRGFPSANVKLSTRLTDNRLQVIVVIDVQPGLPRLIEQRFFYVYGDEERAKPVVYDYKAKVKDRTDEHALTQADADLEKNLRARGWHQALVKHDLGVSSRLVTLRVRVETGPFFKPRFLGNDSYDETALAGALALDTDPDRTPSHLTDKLRDFYVKRGFFDADVKMTTRAGTNLVELVFEIFERQRVAVASRTYPCLNLQELAKLTSGPKTSADVGSEIDSFLEEELPGADLLRSPHPQGIEQQFGQTGGTRRVPIDLDPNKVFVPEIYERAMGHLQELYRNEGFLSAQVGPLQVIRATCDPKSPFTCKPLPLPPLPVDQCTYDARNIPVAVPPIEQTYTCRPDVTRGVRCAPTVDLLIPIKLGPRTSLYDAAFTGVHSIPEKRLASEAKGLVLGEPISRAKIEEGMRKMIDVYRENGFVYADMKYTIEPSIDNTQARVRFDVTEGEQVVVHDIIVRGNVRTRDSVIQRRITLTRGAVYKASEVRKTEERIALLGVFSSVNVALENPEIHQRSKVVIITLVEQVPQHIEFRPGASTGEGLRGLVEYGHRNLFGYALGFTARVQASYLPSEFIFDELVKERYDRLERDFPEDRIARRVTVGLLFPEVGLGPLVRGSVDLIHAHDLLRDFVLTKSSAVGSLFWRPAPQFLISGGQTVEYNFVRIFDQKSIDDLRTSQPGGLPADLERILRVPPGASVAFAQRLVFTWDRRDNAFNAKRGTLSVTGAEVVNWNDTEDTSNANGRFLKLTQTFGGYIPITRNLTFAAQVRVGHIIHFTRSSTTYPDRLFFMGGIETMRGWLQDRFIPDEWTKRIESGEVKVDQIPIRGGDLMFNPRAELRFPLRAPVDTVIFVDMGNLWLNPSNFAPFELRAAVGSGIRLQTPVGPLVFDYGINVTRRPWEDFGAFNFAIGLF